MAAPKLSEVSGIGPATVERLEKAGLGSLRKLAAASLDRIQAVRGFGPARAAAVRDAARAMVAEKGDKKKGKKKDKKARKRKKKRGKRAKEAATGSKDKRGKKRKGKKKGKKKDRKKGKKKK